MQRRMTTLAYRNVKANWRHSLSALLSITAAFYCIVFFEGYVQDIAKMYYDGYHSRSMFADFIVENRKLNSLEGRAEPFDFAMSVDEQKAVRDFVARHQDKVKISARFLNLNGMITNGKSSAIFFAKAMDLDEGRVIRGDQWAWNAIHGKPLHLAGSEDVVLLAPTLAKSLGCRPVGNEKILNPKGGYFPVERAFACETPDVQLSVATQTGQLNAVDLSVVGMVDGGFQELDNKFINLPLTMAQQLLNTDKVSYMTVLLQDQASKSQVKDLFAKEVLSQYPDLELTRWEDHRVGELYRKSLDLLSVFKNFVVIIIISITTLSVINTKVKSIKERTKEIGTLRSLGFSPSAVRSIFLWESFYLSAFGVSLGAVLALVTHVLVANSGIFYRAGLLSMPVPFYIQIDATFYAAAAVVLILIGLAVTVIVCRETLEKKIVENLGHA